MRNMSTNLELNPASLLLKKLIIVVLPQLAALGDDGAAIF